MIREIDNFIFPGLGKEAAGRARRARRRPDFEYFLVAILLISKELFFELAILDENFGLLA